MCPSHGLMKWWMVCGRDAAANLESSVGGPWVVSKSLMRSSNASESWSDEMVDGSDWVG